MLSEIASVLTGRSKYAENRGETSGLFTFSDHFACCADKRNRISDIVQSLGDPLAELDIRLFLMFPDHDGARKLSDSLKPHGLYIAFRHDGVDNDLMLARIDRLEQRSKQSDCGRYSSQFVVVSPIEDFEDKDWRCLLLGNEHVFNSERYASLATDAWERKQAGAHEGNPGLEEFCRNRRNTHRERFTSEYMQKLMNDVHRVAVADRLEHNSRLVEVLREHTLSHYAFLKTGDVQNLKRIREELESIAEKAYGYGLRKAVSKGLSVLSDSAEFWDSYKVLNDYLLEFGQLLHADFDNSLYRQGISKFNHPTYNIKLYGIKEVARRSFGLSDGTSCEYDFLVADRILIPRYEEFYYKGRKGSIPGRLWGFAHPRDTEKSFVVEDRTLTEAVAEEHHKFYKRMQEGSLCFEQLSTPQKLVYLGIAQEIDSRCVLRSIEDMLRREMRIHEEAHMTPYNQGLNSVWQKERHSYLDELTYANPHIALGRRLASSYAEAKDPEECHHQGSADLIDSYIAAAKKKGLVPVDGGTIQERTRYFHDLTVQQVTDIAKNLGPKRKWFFRKPVVRESSEGRSVSYIR